MSATMSGKDLSTWLQLDQVIGQPLLEGHITARPRLLSLEWRACAQVPNMAHARAVHATSTEQSAAVAALT